MPKNNDHEIWVLLYQASDAILAARRRELMKVGISPIQAAVLFIVKNLKELATPAAISRWLMRESHTTSELLIRMEKEGLVRRIKDLPRKNMIRVEVTKKGEEAYQRSREMNVIHKLFSNLGDNERENLRSCLEILRNRVLAELGRPNEMPFP